MTYDLPSWEDSPSTSTPLNSTNLNKVTSAVGDLDTRVGDLEAVPGGVSSVTAGDSTVTIGGTASAVTVAVNAIAESQVTGLTTDLSGKANATHTHAESDVTSLTADLAGKVPSSRTLTAGTGLTGGGDLSANRTFSVAYGTTSGTAAQGNDSRLSLVPSTPYTVTWASTISIDPTLGNNPTITATAATSLSISTTGALSGQMILVSVLASGGSWAITLTGTTLTTGLSSPFTIASGKVGFFGFRYSSLLSSWVLIAQTNSL